MKQTHDMNDLSDLPIDDEMSWVGDASCASANLIPAGPQMDDSYVAPQVSPVMRAWELWITRDARERSSNECLVAIAHGLAEL